MRARACAPPRCPERACQCSVRVCRCAGAAESGASGSGASGGSQNETSGHAAKRARIAGGGDGDDDGGGAGSDGHERFVGGARAGQCKLRCAACQASAVAANQPPFRRIGKLALWSVESVVESLVSLSEQRTPCLRPHAFAVRLLCFHPPASESNPCISLNFDSKYIFF